MTEMTEELKPCPFCGGKNIEVHSYGDAAIGGVPDAFTQCHGCGVTGPGGETEAEAAQAWNTRALAQRPAAQAGEVDIKSRVSELIAEHGTLRAAARSLNIDVGYLSRLEHGDKVHPSSETLAKIGLRDAGVKYQRLVFLPTQPAAQATPGALAGAWDEGYRLGVEDERTSEANIGVAGFGAKVNPARQNPYRAQQATPEPSRGMIGTGAHALANELAQAVAQDDADPDGHDMSAGLFGPNVSAWLRKISADYLPQHATPEPVGEVLQFPPMPEGWPARFRCDSCDGNGEIGELVSMGHFQPPERQTCPDCGGRGWASEEHAFNADHMREFAEAHALLTRPAPGGHAFRAPLQFLSEADARLIAAAPELLEALKMLLRYTVACESVLNAKPAGQIEIARAVIAKATGSKT